MNAINLLNYCPTPFPLASVELQGYKNYYCYCHYRYLFTMVRNDLQCLLLLEKQARNSLNLKIEIHIYEAHSGH